MSARICPRCKKPAPQKICYYVCKPCGWAFDVMGNPAPEGSLDIPDGLRPVDGLAQLLAAAEELAADLFAAEAEGPAEGALRRAAIETALGGIVAALGISPANVAREAVRILEARRRERVSRRGTAEEDTAGSVIIEVKRVPS